MMTQSQKDAARKVLSDNAYAVMLVLDRFGPDGAGEWDITYEFSDGIILNPTRTVEGIEELDTIGAVFEVNWHDYVFAINPDWVANL